MNKGIGKNGGKAYPVYFWVITPLFYFLNAFYCTYN